MPESTAQEGRSKAGNFFDPGKESFHILHRLRPYGDSFKRLGIVFDAKLLMTEAVHKIAAQARWRTRALLRSRCFHSVAAVVRLYKSHVLTYVEHSTPAIYHAAATTLQTVDNVQISF